PGHFREGSTRVRENEDGIEAEPLASPPLAADVAPKTAIKDEGQPPGRLVENKICLEDRLSRLHGHTAQFLKQPVYPLVVARSVPGREDPRSSVECFHLQSGVVRESVHGKPVPDLPCLLEGVLRVCRHVLDNVDLVVKICEGKEIIELAGEGALDLPKLAGITRSDDDAPHDLTALSHRLAHS